MSAYMTFRTPMTDRDCLLDALVAVGVQRARILVSDEAVPLQGYQAGRSAEIVIPRDVTGDRYNDIGFRRTPIGYEAVLSDDHPRFGQPWLERVQDQYDRAWAAKQDRLAEEERRRIEAERRELRDRQVEVLRARAKKAGYRVKEEVRAGDTVRLTLVRRTW